MIRHPPRPTLFPYTPLSQSGPEAQLGPRLLEGDLDVPSEGVEFDDPPQRHPPVGSSNSTPSDGTSRSDRKSTRLNSSHSQISYAVFCLKKKKKMTNKNASMT